MKDKIKELLEEMTKVAPEELSPNAYTFYRTICEILDDSNNLYKFKDRCRGAVEYIKSRQENLRPKQGKRRIQKFNKKGSVKPSFYASFLTVKVVQKNEFLLLCGSYGFRHTAGRRPG